MYIAQEGHHNQTKTLSQHFKYERSQIIKNFLMTSRELITLLINCATCAWVNLLKSYLKNKLFIFNIIIVLNY